MSPNNSHIPEAPISSNDEDSSLGQIKINHTVVASIVRLAALEVDGVCGVGGGFVDGIAEIFSKHESDRGVKVTEDDEGRYHIDLRVVLRFGTELARVAVAIQQSVAEQVMHMTMKPVQTVNVIIDGIKTLKDTSHSQADEPHHPQTD